MKQFPNSFKFQYRIISFPASPSFSTQQMINRTHLQQQAELTKNSKCFWSDWNPLLYLRLNAIFNGKITQAGHANY